MYYFSDLDRTIIYSKKFIKNDCNEISVEKYNGEDISYMTKKSIDILSNINKEKVFIPTTTRSIEQYKRIEFQKNNINFEWAIVCNGGCILHNNERVKEWDIIINERLKECGSFEVIRSNFKEYEDIKGIKKVSEVYKMFFYIIVENDIFNKELLKNYVEYLKKENWCIYYSGRKIYFIPNVIKKEEAIKYLVEKLDIKSFTALGDSIMDKGMLEIANNSIIPKDSFLKEDEINNKSYIPSTSGLVGVEEILNNILRDI